MKDQTLQIGKEQAELLAAIGAYLRDLRLDQDLSLEDVESITKIPVRTLTAIEQGQIDRLPEPVYVQGFIRRYADAIGVDGNEFANAFPTDASLQPVKPSWRGTVETQLRPVHLYLLYTLLVVGAVSGLSFMLNRSSNQSPRYATTSQQLGQPIAQAPTEFYGPPAPAQTSGVTPASPAPAPISSKPVRVSLTVKGQQAWLRIVVDGKTDFEGILPQGTQRSWTADRQVIVRSGDAGAVEVSYNESKPQLMGKPGDVEEKTFSTRTANLNSLNLPALAASSRHEIL
jgi:cytoskeletal protein RodZ